MAGNVDNQGSIISPNDQKVLFAEDLVNYILQKNSIPAIFFNAGRHGGNGVRIFDHNLRLVADFIKYTVGSRTDQAYYFIMDHNLNTIPWFGYYAITIQTKCVGLSSYAESFFQYSVHLAHLAAKLFSREFQEAPRMAMLHIVEAMDLDLFIWGRAILDVVAREYAENQQKLFNQVVKTLEYSKYETFVQVFETNMHEQLSYCAVTGGNMQRQEYTGGNASECQVNEKQMARNTETTSASLQSQLHSELEDTEPRLSDPRNGNPYNVLSSDSVGVSGSSRDEPGNLNSRKCSADSNEEKKRRIKKLKTSP